MPPAELSPGELGSVNVGDVVVLPISSFHCQERAPPTPGRHLDWADVEVVRAACMNAVAPFVGQAPCRSIHWGHVQNRTYFPTGLAAWLMLLVEESQQ